MCWFVSCNFVRAATRRAAIFEYYAEVLGLFTEDRHEPVYAPLRREVWWNAVLEHSGEQAGRQDLKEVWRRWLWGFREAGARTVQ